MFVCDGESEGEEVQLPATPRRSAVPARVVAMEIRCGVRTEGPTTELAQPLNP